MSMAERPACLPVRIFQFLNDSAQWGKVVENPLQFTRVRLRMGRTTLRFRSGFDMLVDRRNRRVAEKLARFAYVSGAVLRGTRTPGGRAWLVSLSDGTIESPTGVRMTLDSMNPAILDETFVRQIHFAGYDLSGQTVVDAGAFVGDTSLYFAAMGASVVAYEPDPRNFRDLTRNLELNPALSARVRAVNAAVGVDGEISFQAGLGGASGAHAAGGTPVRVRSVSLATIFRENGLDHAFLLKADIKGAEFELVHQAELGRFHRVAIEYQTYRPDQSPDQIIEALRTFGFPKVRLYHHGPGTYSLDHGGMIEAEHSP